MQAPPRTQSLASGGADVNSDNGPRPRALRAAIGKYGCASLSLRQRNKPSHFAEQMPINPEAAIYTPQRITAVAEAFAEDGGDIGQLLESTGISVDDLGNPETRVSCQQICSVFRNALQLSPDPTLALRAGSRMHLTSYGMFGYALLSALNFEERNEIVIRYHRMCTPGVRISSMHDEQALRYGYEVVLGGATADGLHRFIIEFGYAAHLSVARDLYGPEFSFSSVGVTYAEPSHAGAMRILFGCPVRFNQQHNHLGFDASFAERTRGHPDNATHHLAIEHCQRLLAEAASQQGIASAVRTVLIKKMPCNYPTIDRMAEALLMDSRTLRRKLASLGTTYRALLSEVRMQLAIEFLRKPRMTNGEIASILGYSDPSNFRHAFVRWTGRTPTAYRFGNK
ncbi:AraC family transcriptional regulator [Pseudoduganella sp. UC29_71]|uniref:AraC family transcriptional regulator n=1 Tax=Pseudoduganella sp. UC29_71 TaxID=3350174 RepID=UPI00366E4FB5